MAIPRVDQPGFASGWDCRTQISEPFDKPVLSVVEGLRANGFFTHSMLYSSVRAEPVEALFGG
jgi:hypothetical protein